MKVNGDSSGKPNGVPVKANSDRSEAKRRLTIASAVSDQELSQEILKTVAQLLKTSPRHHGR